MTRLRERNAELEARARLHATRIEDLDDEVTRLRRQVRTLETERRAQATIIRRRNHQLLLAGETIRRQVLCYLALSRVRDVMRPARVWDTGTPGVEVTGR